ncbi:MAG: hypothetical protein COV26_00940 [Candidatus Nealsonbacteria bacterium CG10_big_fil_rev_8_21_14_0_10_36_23]|uniref:SpoVT-AbrB domain-containing protein n=1 Tax=Candidatus Nealsonbacteria bacterium CG10_big_fil_rev_8_21_14_0_10_36_23 TaxID=1974709 RepID=A0A2H0TLE6_9BACT|nr:MAG: hypothetical protein COV26_00940 [Candidatus Nealsonbacteria bacterium CG10_big_fil_rev_8_21_14_0_10_36_23]
MTKNKFIRKITKKGKYSYLIIIPKGIIDNLHWRERQKVVLKTYGKDKILISDYKPKSKRK